MVFDFEGRWSRAGDGADGSEESSESMTTSDERGFDCFEGADVFGLKVEDCAFLVVLGFADVAAFRRDCGGSSTFLFDGRISVGANCGVVARRWLVAPGIGLDRPLIGVRPPNVLCDALSAFSLASAR